MKKNYNNLANNYFQKGKTNLAIKYYLKAIKQFPKLPQPYNNLARCYYQKGNYKSSVKYALKALSKDPKFTSAYSVLGSAYLACGQEEEAREALEKFIKKSPNSFEELYMLGCIYSAKNNFQKAEKLFSRSILINPNFAFSYNELGNLYKNIKNYQKAIYNYKHALILKPDSALIYLNLGITESHLGNIEKAIDCLKKATILDNRSVYAHYSLGMLYIDTDKEHLAIKHLKQALKINPRFHFAKNLLTVAKLKICDWKNLPKPTAHDLPFVNILTCDNKKTNFESARNWSKSLDKNSANKFPLPKNSKRSRKIKVGYLSGDFFDHPTAHLILRLFKLHNRRKFVINTYSYGPNDESFYRKQIQKYSDNFVDLSGVDNPKAAEKIYKDEVDILVDLKGHTEGSRIEILSFRPAPIQITWLGFPGTTGANFIDYMITDKIVTPPNEKKYYSEKILYIPHTYQVTNDKQAISDKRYERRDFGLPTSTRLDPAERTRSGREKKLPATRSPATAGRSVVFCSFNQAYKIEPKGFAVWMKILKKVKGSVLWLWKQNESMEDNLKKEAKKHGVSPNRLIFSPKLPREEHLARLALADIALDTFVYNGHTTTSDCLFAGVPVVTLKGKHFASRVSASLLTAAGLPELITKTPKEFENLAAAMATDPKLLKKLKELTRKARKPSSLFNTKLFVKNLEKIFEKTWMQKNKSIDLLEKYNQLGINCLEAKDYEGAKKFFLKAKSIEPKSAIILNNLGNAYHYQHKINLAKRKYQKALKIDPYLYVAYANLGVALGSLGYYKRAVDLLKKSLSINPNYYQAYCHLGDLEQDYKHPEKALEYFEEVLEINPRYTYVFNKYAEVLIKVNEWQKLDRISKKIGKLTFGELAQNKKTTETPFFNILRSQDPKLNLLIAQTWSKDIADSVSAFDQQFRFSPRKNKKIKVGYVSADFKSHVIAHQIFSLFKLHDRRKFEVYAYCLNQDDGSFYRKEIKNNSDKFVDMYNSNDSEVARKIYEDKIDILVDLMGHTKNNRLAIFALRPAPIQVTYLGFTASLGANFIDYAITDKIITPKSIQRYYSEKLSFMPDCYQIASYKYLPKPSRQALAQVNRKWPKDSFVFCSFNNSYKITEKMFLTWMKILKKVPKGVLWLLGEYRLSKKNLTDKAANLGVDKKRLIFAKRRPLPDHLQRVTHADIALDTFPYNGGATTSNALWAGVPVITMIGNTYSSRMSASFLTAAGLPKLITRNTQQYEQLAVNLATNPKKLEQIRKSLIMNRKSSSLFNTKTFVRNLEKIYLKMYDQTNKS